MINSKFSLVLALISLLVGPQIALDHSYAQTTKFKTGYSLVADQLILVEFAQTEAEREMGLSGEISIKITIEWCLFLKALSGLIFG